MMKYIVIRLLFFATLVAGNIHHLFTQVENGLNLKAWHALPVSVGDGESYPSWPDYDRFILEDVTSSFHQEYMKNNEPSHMVNSADSFPEGLTGKPKNDYSPNSWKFQRLLIRMDGFITPDESGEYKFRVASKNGSCFSLSSDTSFENLSPLIGVYGDSTKWVNSQCSDSKAPNYCGNYHPSTSSAEFNKFPSQQNATVSLLGGNFYAIKFEYKSYFGDNVHFTVEWKPPGNDEFTPIPNSNLWTAIGTYRPKLETPMLNASLSGSNIALTWNEVSGADEYLIIQDGIEIGKIENTDTLLQDMENGTYGFVVIAVGDPETYINSDPSSIEYVEVNTLGLNKTEADNFIISPNPVKNEIFIKNILEMKNFEVYSIDGRRTNIYSLAPNDIISVKQLERGIYVLKITTSKGILIRKFLKE
jgi:hypothetical protein